MKTRRILCLLAILAVIASGCNGKPQSKPYDDTDSAPVKAAKTFIQAINDGDREAAELVLHSEASYEEEGKSPVLIKGVTGNSYVRRLVEKETRFVNPTLTGEGDGYCEFEVDQTNYIWSTLWNLKPEDMHYKYKFLVADGLITRIFVYKNDAADKILTENTNGTINIKVDQNDDGYLDVTQVGAASPAAGAGMQEGDVIKKIDGVDIKDMRDTYEIAYRLNGRIGEPVELTVERGGKEMTFKPTRVEGKAQNP